MSSLATLLNLEQLGIELKFFYARNMHKVTYGMQQTFSTFPTLILKLYVLRELFHF